jgi:hypothetical protein
VAAPAVIASGTGKFQAAVPETLQLSAVLVGPAALKLAPVVLAVLPASAVLEAAVAAAVVVAEGEQSSSRVIPMSLRNNA